MTSLLLAKNILKHGNNKQIIPQLKSLSYLSKLQMTQRIDSIILQRYQIIKKCGQGAYGHVWKAKDRKTSNLVALKKIYDAYRNQTDAQRTYRQIMYSRQFFHRNITKLLGFHASEQSRDIYTIMEFVDYDLQQVIRESLFERESQRYFTMFQIISAVQFLHNNDLVHRDLKPANILLTNQLVVKLCDFGLVKSVHPKSDEQEIIMTQNIATRWYRAPQILLGSNNYGKAVDIWSMGCIFAQIITGKVLFSGQNALNQLQKILQITGKPKMAEVSKITHSQTSLTILQNLEINQIKILSQVLKNVDADLIDLISRMLHFDPNNRITINEIKNHPFFKKFIKNDAPKLSRFKKQPKPITIQFDNQRFNVKKYKSLLSIFADPIFQVSGYQSPTKNRMNKVPSYLRQKNVNPQISKYVSTSDIKVSASSVSLTSKKYLDVPEESGYRFKKSYGIQQIAKINDMQTNNCNDKIRSDNTAWLSGIKRQRREGNNQTRQTFDKSVSPKEASPANSSKRLKQFNAKSFAFDTEKMKNTNNKIGFQSAIDYKISFEQKRISMNQQHKIMNTVKCFPTKSFVELNKNTQPKLINQTNKKLGTKIKGQIMINNSQKHMNLYLPSHMNATKSQKNVFKTSKQKRQFLKKMNVNSLTWNN